MPSFSLLLTLAVIALHSTLSSARPIDNSGNAYGGKGGYASGGNVTYPEKEKNLLSSLGLGKALVNLKSGNAGHGGHADSGDALGGLAPTFGRWTGIGGSNSGNAYAKDGGNADGGSVQGTNDALLNIDSNNAGHGGAASSGTAVGSSGSGSKEDHGDERDGDHEDYHWDDDHEDHDHKDDYLEDDYEEDDYEDYVDRKRHENQPTDKDCDC
ncbi:hypothetical protein C0992_007189 [Termitomyces sp. T32_za158]|nr:hypothetical protein C0992_007189 [Termitomyces sp. T32_za158]